MCVGALAVAAPAAADPIVLPSPAALVDPPPPLATVIVQPTQSENELRVPGRIGNIERVVVGLRADGSASSIDVTQRLLLNNAGDYSFVIPAPVLRVEPAPGTQSQPGQRTTGIIWQGFSPGRRILAARASLDPLPAERGLPVSIRIARRGDASVVQVISVARRRLTVARGTAPVDRLVELLRGFRRSVMTADRIALTRTLQVDGTARGARTIVVDVPMRVRGSVTAGGRRFPVSWVIGGGRPLTRELSIPGPAEPKLALEVELFRPPELLPDDRGLTLDRLQHALGSVALAGQYAQFLASPDQLGPSRTAYSFRSVAEAEETPEVAPGSSDDSDTLAIVLAAVLGGAALVGLAVVWAHS